MKIKLGNIISEQEIIKEDIINYYINYNKIDNNLPTLIIGWKLTKTMFGEDNVSILNKKLKNNLFWTFNKEERQIDYDKDIEEFKKLLPFDFIKEVKFEHIDPIVNNYIFLDQLLSKLKKEEKKINCYIASNNTIYLKKVKSINENNLIFSINLDVIEFLNWDKFYLVNELKKISNIFITEEKDKVLIDDYKKIFQNLNNFPKYIPFLMDKLQD